VPSLEVRVRPTEVVPGEEVEVWARVVDPDQTVTGGEFGLWFVNRDSDAEVHSAVVATEPFASLAADWHSTRLRLPLGSPASFPTLADWRAGAVLARKRRRDVRESVALRVRLTSNAAAGLGEPRVTGRHLVQAPEACVPTLELARRVVSPGETIEGTFRLVARSATTQAVKLYGIKVVLERGRAFPTVSSQTHARQQLADDVELPVGVPHEYPFALQVPADALPTCDPTAAPTLRVVDGKDAWGSPTRHYSLDGNRWVVVASAQSKPLAGKWDQVETEVFVGERPAPGGTQ
jgi:hypothetical protein